MEHDTPTIPAPAGETGPCRALGCTDRAYGGASRCARHGGGTVPRMPAVTAALLELCRATAC